MLHIKCWAKCSKIYKPTPHYNTTIFFIHRPTSPILRMLGYASFPVRALWATHLHLFPPLPRKTRERDPIARRNRCAPATLNGYRCTRQILYPMTVRAVHAQYFLTHLRLPHGGATSPHLHDTNDIRPNAALGFPTPEMRRAPTSQSLLFIQRVRNLFPP